MAVIRDTGGRAPLPPFTDEHEELRETIARWVGEEIAPHVDEWEEAGEFPRGLYRRAGELGFLGLKYPVELGGQGGDCVHDAVWAEELAAAGAAAGVGSGLGAQTGIATPPIFRFGTPEQHERLLRPAIRGELIGALGITEPGAGSDVASIRTHARRVDGGYVVNGAKTFITNGVSFTDVEVPAENLLGRENEGFYLIMANFQWERLLMALGAVGAMRRLLTAAIDYAGEREAFGRPIGRFQAIRHKIAEIAVKLEAGRSLTYAGLRRYASGADATREVTMAKLLTQRAAVEVADEVLQIHGGYGYMREYGIERALRDLRLGPIGGGTEEIMKEILGRGMGL